MSYHAVTGVVQTPERHAVVMSPRRIAAASLACCTHAGPHGGQWSPDKRQAKALEKQRRGSESCGVRPVISTLAQRGTDPDLWCTTTTDTPSAPRSIFGVRDPICLHLHTDISLPKG